MTRSLVRIVSVAIALLAISSSGALAATLSSGALAATLSAGPISDISSACSGQNAEVEQAVDPATGYIYEEWIGCGGIGFSRSTDGGNTWSAPIQLPGGVGASKFKTWDPAIAVAPNGTVYASFMVAKNAQSYPVVDASFDHGATFPQVTPLLPPDHRNWGDRDFVAVGPDGSVYVSWDYAPSQSTIVFVCASNGSCGYTAGELNVVIQKSTDGGRSFGPMVHLSPGYPTSGADSAPMVVEPNGTIDVLYQDYPTDPSTFALSPGNEYFSSSSDGGATWSAPVEVGASAGTMSLQEWWIDGAIGIDSAGNLYATWDTQTTSSDTGWLSYSTDHGASWSAPVQVTDTANAPHIVEAAGGGRGIAYVGWLSSNQPAGYAQYLRAYQIGRGWLDTPVQISTQYGDPSIWPGDTFGISTLSPTRVALSWGSATPTTPTTSEIYGATVNAALP
jgi:hypothetical protein